MPKYYVESGKMRVILHCDGNEQDAAVNAILWKQPKVLCNGVYVSETGFARMDDKELGPGAPPTKPRKEYKVMETARVLKRCADEGNFYLQGMDPGDDIIDTEF